MLQGKVKTAKSRCRLGMRNSEAKVNLQSALHYTPSFFTSSL
jgi:hypothetical protein